MHNETPEVCVPCERDDRNADVRAILKKERKIKNAIGSTLYTGFVVVYTMILLYALFFPKVQPFNLFSKYEVFPRTHNQMLAMWASFKTFDPIYYGFIYVMFTFGGSYIMRKKDRLRLVKSQRTWNVLLAVFSIWSSVRYFSFVVPVFSRNGSFFTLRPLVDIVCDGSSGDIYVEQSPVGFYSAVFIFSKYAEFIDTFFIVVHKKPLLTLHWWHHFSVSVFSMHVGMTQLSCGFLFSLMNYPVHGYMYTYYALASFGYRPSKWAMSITVLQIAQMVGGLLITIVAIYGKYYKPDCVWQNPSTMHIPVLTMSLCIYGSYFVLFTKFYIDRYLSPKIKAS